MIGLIAAACAGEIGGAPATDGANGGGDAATAADAEVSAPDASAPGELLGTYQLTYYWITSEDEFTGPADTDIFEPDCTLLSTVAEEFFDSLRLEGTGRLLDGRVVNYDGACPCATSPCFFPVDEDHPWGVGAQNRPLVPFRSVAVDTSFVAIGAALYVEELDGVLMPGDAPWGAFVHDGCVVADDVGGGIDGQQVDFFSAARAHYLTLDGLLGLNDVTVFAGGARCAP